MKGVKIENPCPVQLMRMTQSGNSYHCKSCSSAVVDFRSKTKKEIEKEVSDSACGIFYSDQLTIQPKLTGFKKMAFYAMTFLSVIGFNVSPASAQEIDTVKTEEIQSLSIQLENEQEIKERRKAYKKYKRRHPFRRRKQFRGKIMLIEE